MYKLIPKELQWSGDVKNDILKFCTNIISADRTSIFGGKVVFWHFMKDAAIHLNFICQGFRYSQNPWHIKFKCVVASFMKYQNAAFPPKIEVLSVEIIFVQNFRISFFAQTLRIYDECRMCNLFNLNFVSPM